MTLYFGFTFTFHTSDATSEYNYDVVLFVVLFNGIRTKLQTSFDLFRPPMIMIMKGGLGAAPATIFCDVRPSSAARCVCDGR